MSTLAVDNPKTLIAVFPTEHMYDIESIEKLIGAPFEDWEDYDATIYGLFVKVKGKYTEVQPHKVWEGKSMRQATEILLVPERIEGGVK
tara:strand:+ start:675 stop:941 length:267 start_codon:yes stop_codon:yes gene_type:complete